MNGPRAFGPETSLVIVTLLLLSACVVDADGPPPSRGVFVASPDQYDGDPFWNSWGGGYYDGFYGGGYAGTRFYDGGGRRGGYGGSHHGH